MRSSDRLDRVSESVRVRKICESTVRCARICVRNNLEKGTNNVTWNIKNRWWNIIIWCDVWTILLGTGRRWAWCVGFKRDIWYDLFQPGMIKVIIQRPWAAIARHQSVKMASIFIIKKRNCHFTKTEDVYKKSHRRRRKREEVYIPLARRLSDESCSDELLDLIPKAGKRETEECKNQFWNWPQAVILFWLCRGSWWGRTGSCGWRGEWRRERIVFDIKNGHPHRMPERSYEKEKMNI